MIIKNCVICGKQIKAAPSQENTKKYCSKKCFLLARSKAMCGKDNPEYKDETGNRYGRLVGKEFSHTKNKSAYWVWFCDCGKECVKRASDVRIGNTKSCGCLQKEGLIRRNKEYYHKSHYHSAETRKKMSDMRKGLHAGDKHPNWKGGYYNSERDNYYESAESRLWRKSVYQRDNHTCQICDTRGGKINAHHILDWVKFEELRHNTSNGITLCVPCHRVIHSKLFKGQPVIQKILMSKNIDKEERSNETCGSKEKDG